MPTVHISIPAILKTGRRYLFNLVLTLVMILAAYLAATASFRQVEKFISYRLEINRMYEQWLIVRTDAMNYLRSDKQRNVQARLEASVAQFDGRLVLLFRNEFERLKSRSPKFAWASADLLLSWEGIKEHIAEMLTTGADFEPFSRQIYWLANETVGFDYNLKEMIGWFDSLNRRQFLLQWRAFFLLVLVASAAFFLLVKYARQSLEAQRAREKTARILDSVVSGREDERSRLAIEIHDTIIQDLTFSKMLCFDLQKAGMRPEVRRKLEGVTDLIAKTIRQVRDVTYDLMPPEIEKDIESTFLECCRNFTETTGIVAETSVTGFRNVEMGKAQKLNLYRILQECLNNIRKHSGATRVQVRLLLTYPYIVFRISDNGRGASPEELHRSRPNDFHLGMRGIEERVNMFDGEMNIQSIPGQGLTIGIKMLLVEQENGQ